MSEMIERVARALTVLEGDNPDGRTASLLNEREVWWHHRIPQARAAIAAMREPTDGLCRAGAAKWDDDLCTESNALNMWSDMIDAALRD